MFFFFDDSVVPGFEQMIKPILRALQQLGGAANLKDLDAKTIEIMKLPDEILEIPHKGSTNRTEVAYRLAWARTYLKKYGLIKNSSRGIWSVTQKLPANIDEIDSNLVVQTVRRGSIASSSNELRLSGVENALAFENFVISIIMDIVKKQGKTYYLSYTDSFDFGYDVLLPQGIDSIDNDVYCTIKYFKSNNINLSTITAEAIKVARNIKTGTILLIVNGIINDEERLSIKKQLPAEEKIDTVIWDSRDLTLRTDPESEYANYLINPKQALVNSTIYRVVTDEEKEKIKANYLNKVKQSYLQENLILLLGAGVSIDAGIPLWNKLIKELLINMISNKIQDRKYDKKALESLSTLAYSSMENSPIAQMRYIRAGLTDEEYYKIVHKVFYARRINTKTKLLDAIAKICKPQRTYNGIEGIITYNFDDILEQCFARKEIDFKTVFRDTDMPSTTKLNVYHVHGFLPRVNSISQLEINLVFSEEDYHQVYRDAYSWSNLVQLNAFRDNTCLFIGCSLTDPNLRRLLDVASRNGEGARHFAFMKKHSLISDNTDGVDEDIAQTYQRIDDNIKEDYYKQLGLNIIWVDNYNEIPKLLYKIIDS